MLMWSGLEERIDESAKGTVSVGLDGYCKWIRCTC